MPSRENQLSQSPSCIHPWKERVNDNMQWDPLIAKFVHCQFIYRTLTVCCSKATNLYTNVLKKATLINQHADLHLHPPQKNRKKNEQEADSDTGSSLFLADFGNALTFRFRRTRSCSKQELLLFTHFYTQPHTSGSLHLGLFHLCLSTRWESSGCAAPKWRNKGKMERDWGILNPFVLFICQ